MGECGINCAHSPHVMSLLRFHGVWQPQQGGARSARAAEDPSVGRGPVVASPGLRRRPVARVGWQARPATGCHMARGRRAVSPQPNSRAAWFPPTNFDALQNTAHLIKAGSSSSRREAV